MLAEHFQISETLFQQTYMFSVGMRQRETIFICCALSAFVPQRGYNLGVVQMHRGVNLHMNCMQWCDSAHFDYLLGRVKLQMYAFQRIILSHTLLCAIQESFQVCLQILLLHCSNWKFSAYIA